MPGGFTWAWPWELATQRLSRPEPHLGCVMVEDDGIEIPAVVVLDEVLCGVRRLQAPSPHTLVLQQGLVQGKQHLGRGKREK